MKTIKLILVTAIMTCSVTSCQAQEGKKVTDKAFSALLSKFKVVEPPANYKKVPGRLPSMTHEEAIRFIHKKQSDLSYMVGDMGEGETMEYYKEDNSPACHFKYQLNDSIYILCIREGIHDENIETLFVYLYSFSFNGEVIGKCLVGEQFTRESDWVSFVLLDKIHIRVFYYEDNNTREKEGFHSTVYYVNYEITGDGKFIEKDKSDITWLKDGASLYNDYDPKSDDPMNEYDF
jgi:hypothetical protein